MQCQCQSPKAVGVPVGTVLRRQAHVFGNPNCQQIRNQFLVARKAQRALFEVCFQIVGERFLGVLRELDAFDGIAEHVEKLLGEIQENIFAKAKRFLDDHIYECNDYDEFKQRIADGGFFLCPWDGTAETEAKIKEDTQATIRCVPFDYSQDNLGNDMVSGKPAKFRVVVARSY